MGKKDPYVQNKHSKVIQGENVNSFGELLDTAIGAITGSNNLNNKQTEVNKNEDQGNLEPPKYT